MINSIYISDIVVLDPLTELDVPDIFTAINTQREYLGKWLAFVETTKEPSDTAMFVEYAIALAESNREPVFVIRVDGAFAGLAGFRTSDVANRRTEIGYWLSFEFQGRGIVTESVRALLDLAFSELDMNRVQIKCATGNKPSIKVPERLGFIFEGTERDGELLTGGVFTDLNVYSMLKADWKRGTE